MFRKGDMNKLGFDKEQQAKLENALKLAQYAAAVVTLLHQPTFDQAQVMRILMDLHDFAVGAYPDGPRTLVAQLNEISAFCDLSLVTTARSLDTGELM